MASTDRRGADLLRELRIDHGLSPEGLSHAIFKQGLGYVSGRTIRYVEHTGRIPSPRVQFALARYFERAPTSIWALRPLRRAVAA